MTRVNVLFGLSRAKYFMQWPYTLPHPEHHLRSLEDFSDEFKFVNRVYLGTYTQATAVIVRTFSIDRGRRGINHLLTTKTAIGVASPMLVTYYCTMSYMYRAHFL